MKNLKLAAKIGLGFGVVIAIAVALGAISILSMTGVLGDARRLAVESVPLVTVANNVERSALQTMFNMRGYALSGNAEYGELARKNLADTKKHLADATELVGKYPRLSYLKSAAASSQTKLEEYSKQAETTEALMKSTADARALQEEAAATFMKACFQYRDTARGARTAAIDEIIDMGYDLRIANLKAQAYSDPSILEKGLESFNGLTAKLAIIRAGAAGGQIAAIQKSADDYVAACDTLLDNMKKMTELDKSRNAVAQGVLGDAEGAALAGLKDANDVSALAVARLVSAVITLIIGLSCAAIIGIAVAIAITRTITKPLTKGVSFAQIIASGDLTQLLDIRQRDEVGILADALNGMAQKLKDMVASVQQNALQVASSSEEISASAQKLAEGAQSQASTLEETSAAVEELASSVDQVAEHAQSQAAAVDQGSASMAQVKESIEAVSTNLAEISDLAGRSVDNAMEGGKAVQEVVDGI
ncbi:MAG TPA: HAMP domain-containing protein, partial [Spirochaetia bacterium]